MVRRDTMAGMTWFFAIVIVALMGVVAVVATGRGGSLGETFDDRPDSRVQADGPLTAQDLRRVRFSTAFRGYRMSEVDALLDRLAAEMEPRRCPISDEPRTSDDPWTSDDPRASDEPRTSEETA